MLVLHVERELMNDAEEEKMIEDAINYLIAQSKCDTNKLSDGYHTFSELYDHRIALFIALCHNRTDAWKSVMHSDESIMAGWFIAGIGREQGEQITYHLPLSLWDTLHCEVLTKAPKYDGHSPSDVVKRLLRINE